MKVVINACFGGFNVSNEGMRRYAELKGIKLWVEQDKQFSIFTNYWTVAPEDRQSEHTPHEWHEWPLEKRAEWNERYRREHLSNSDFERDDPILVQVVEELGEAASGRCARLKVVEIPDGIDYEIDEYDGNEHVAEKHRTWS